MQKFHCVYRITNILLLKYYIGKHSGILPSEKDIGVKYFSSSLDKDFIFDQKENPQNYRYEIMGNFISSNLAIQYEIWLHNKFNVGVNLNYYNRSKQTSTGFCPGNNSIPIWQINKNTRNPIQKWDSAKQASEKLILMLMVLMLVFPPKKHKFPPVVFFGLENLKTYQKIYQKHGSQFGK